MSSVNINIKIWKQEISKPLKYIIPLPAGQQCPSHGKTLEPRCDAYQQSHQIGDHSPVPLCLADLKDQYSRCANKGKRIG